MRIIMSSNSTWNLVNFRATLIRTLIAQGYEVVAVAPSDEYVSRLAELGCRYIPIPMDNKGMHPGCDLLLLWRFYRLFQQERPSMFLGYTVKPNVYGSLAAHALNIPVINNIAGLGTVFINKNWLIPLVKILYRLALYRSAKVFFQNEDDRQLFLDAGLVRKDITDRLPGSGIDLRHFSFTPMPVSGRRDEFRFLLIARMLWNKGVGEYVTAARRIRQRFPHTKCCLLGFLNVPNPAAISNEQIQAWVHEGVVHYLGASSDVRPHIASADCVVLPSYYREGVPRSLIEAAAIGRPIITTDAVGCREIVDNRINGFLCKVKDVDDLVEKMEWMIQLPLHERIEMGKRGREKVEREFDERFVIDAYLRAIKDILEQRQGNKKW